MSDNKAEKLPRGRPIKHKLNAQEIENLAAIDCTVEEIASVLDCSKDTLERRFMRHIERGRERGRASLKRQMHKLAMEGNCTMAIWLSKQTCGYRDHVDQTTKLTYGDMKFNVEFGDGSKDDA